MYQNYMTVNPILITFLQTLVSRCPCGWLCCPLVKSSSE